MNSPLRPDAAPADASLTAPIGPELILPRVDVHGDVVRLNAAECALVTEISRGLTNRAAAAVLGRTEAAVSSQLSRIYRKLRLRRRAQLIMMFRG